VNALQAALLGFVQGVTEFLPISSDGHLVIFQELLGIHQKGILFEVAVHVATLLSVLVFFRGRILALVRGALAGNRDAWRYGGKLALATLPAVVAGLVALDFFEALFERPWTAGAGLLITGTCLWTTRATLPRARATEPTWLQALLIGCAQVTAIAPGISRSGTTVATALAFGIAPLAAAEFSFLMAIPAITGAAVLQLPEAAAASSDAWRAVWIGGAIACATGIGALALFVYVLRSGAFYRFAWYAWAVGTAFLVWLALR
jgi:undecaprenyl-diphosphatase